MKTTKVLLILVSIISLILALLYYESIKNCDLCEKEEQSIDVLSKDNDFSLKIDCTKESVFQVFQYDLANGYSIMGRIKLNPSDSTMIDSIAFKLYEAGKCTRYSIEKVVYSKHDLGHLIDFTIVGRKNNSDNKPVPLKQSIPVNVGERVYARITSKDFPKLNTHLPSPEEFKKVSSSPEELENIVRHFPPLICPAKIYASNNN